MIIDGLEVQIQSDATRAIQQLDVLLNRLTAVASGLSSVNRGGMSSLASGVYNLGNAMKNLKANTTSADFTRLASNIQKLSVINTSGIMNLALSLTTFTSSASQFSSAISSITALGDAVKTLGYKQVDKAVANIPILTAELQKMMSVLSTAPAVSQNLVDMTNAMANLAAQGSNAGTATKSLNSALNTGAGASRKMFSATNILSGALKKQTKHTHSLAYAFGKFYANFFLIIRGIKALGKAIESSMDYIETYNYYNVIMDKLGTEFSDAYEQFGYDSAEVYANSFRKRLNELTGKMTGFSVGDTGELSITGSSGLGLNPETIVNYEASISSITNSLGLMGETSINTAKAMTMLAADMSSLRNVDLETVMTNLQSGLIGQSRALYKYGIDITNNTLQTYAFAQGIDKAVSEMTQAEKMQLRMLAILDQSKVAWGDMANTINGVANQFRVFKQQVQNLARIIGNLFLPVVQIVLPYVNGFVMALQRMFYWVGSLLGVDWEALSDGISEGYTDTGLEAIADSAEEADESLTKLNKTIRSWDELNLLSKGEAGLGDTSDLIDLSSEIATAVGEYESVWSAALEKMNAKASEIADNIFKNLFQQNAGDLGAYLGNSIAGILNKIPWSSIKNKAFQFSEGLANFINGAITVDSLGSVADTIGGVISTIIGAGTRFFTTIDAKGIGESIASAINKFMSSVKPSEFASGVNAFCKALLDALSAAIKKISWSDVFEWIGTALSNLSIESIGVIGGVLTIKGIKSILFSSVAMNAIKTGIVAKISGINLGSIPLAISGLTIAGSNQPLIWQLGNIFAEIIDGAWEYAFPKSKQAWDSFWTGDNPTNAFKEALSNIFNIDDAKSYFSTAKQHFDDAFNGVFKFGEEWNPGESILLGIVNGFVGAFSFLTAPVKNFFDLIVELFCRIFGIHSPATEMEPIGSNILQGVISGFVSGFGLVKNVINFFKTNIIDPLFNKENWTFNGIKEGLVGAFTLAIDAAKSLWNSFVDWINSLNGTEAIVKGSGVDSRFKPRSVFGYANGGFPTSADIFYANENGIPELVGTLNGSTAVASNNEITGIIEKIDEVLPYLQALVQKDNRAVVNLNADAKRMFDVAVEQNNKEVKRTGRSPFLL